VHLLSGWIDQQHALEPVMAGLQEAISAYQRTHPDDDFALLHHRDTTLRDRFEALLLAPLVGIERLSEFATQEHPMATLIGHSYQSTTLSQFLGQLERIDAAPWLLPILFPAPGSKRIYVDGHMIEVGPATQPIGAASPCTKARLPCVGASWQARKPSSVMTRVARGCTWRIIHRICICPS
jgi:hypothetical protein